MADSSLSSSLPAKAAYKRARAQAADEGDALDSASPNGEGCEDARLQLFDLEARNLRALDPARRPSPAASCCSCCLGCC